MSYFEEIFYNGALASVGDPMFIGILVWIFFAIFVMLQNLPTSGKIVIMVPATILALGMFSSSGWMVLAGLAFAVMLYFGIKRFAR